MCRLKAQWNYTGIDFSKDSIEILNKKAKEHEYFKAATFIQSFPVGLSDASFDVVLLLEVLEHLDDEYLKDILSETYRLLKPGGVVVVSVPNREDLSLLKKICPECGAIFHQWQHVRSWNSESIKQYLQQYGFSFCKIKILDFSAQGLGFKAILRKIMILSKKYILQKNYTAPHMIAVFQKD
ncbi:MAG: class I SAM-dependent methyltransferase [Clostridiales bacterium]|nr:class I SAM-dependent methyltransferase [Clostridiales bacterium]